MKSPSNVIHFHSRKYIWDFICETVGAILSRSQKIMQKYTIWSLGKSLSGIFWRKRKNIQRMPLFYVVHSPDYLIFIYGVVCLQLDQRNVDDRLDKGFLRHITIVKWDAWTFTYSFRSGGKFILSVAYFTKEANTRLAKPPLNIIGGLTNLE